jgi:hypothetical protein
MRRSRSTVPITIVAMLSITAKGLAADGYPRALEAAATLEGGPGGGTGTTYQASGIEWLTLARFAVLILRPVNTGRWAHSAKGRFACLFPTSVKHPERRYI